MATNKSANMAGKFQVGDNVFCRDKGDSEWVSGVVTSVNPLMVRYTIASPDSQGFVFDEVKSRSTEARSRSKEDDQKRDETLKVSSVGGGAEVTLSYFDPEDEQFWVKGGKKIAYVNLLVSTVALCLGFAMWKCWGGVVANIKAAHKNDASIYAFGYDDKKDHGAAVGLLVPAAGISGATSRLVHTWAVNPCGGRTTTVGSCLLGALSMFIAFLALMNGNGHLWLLYLAAMLSGIGGGIFSSSVSNISFWFPSRLQGTALGIDGGVGNLGVALAIFFVPRLSSQGICLAGKTGTCQTGVLGGKYVYNPFLFFSVLALFAAFWAYERMNNMPNHGRKFTAEGEARNDLSCKDVMECRTLFKYFGQMQLYGYAASLVAVLIFILINPVIKGIAVVVVLRAFLSSAMAFGIAWVLLFYCSWGHVKERLFMQLETYKIKERNSINMCILYVMTFGSFIGFAGAFGGLITGLFKQDAANYAYIGPVCGSLSRVLGGFLSDRFGGAVLTHICACTMMFSTLVAAVVIRISLGVDDTTVLFPIFVFFFIILFTATGIGNASTFKQMATLCKDTPEKRGNLLGFTATVAAYGGFIITAVCKAGVAFKFIDVCFFIFFIYYAFCALINYETYTRPGCAFPC